MIGMIKKYFRQHFQSTKDNLTEFLEKRRYGKMEKRIVVPIDYSDASKDVALFADKWAVRTIGKLYFLHVSRLPQVSYYPGAF